jgi:hypothetical protein
MYIGLGFERRPCFSLAGFASGLLHQFRVPSLPLNWDLIKCVRRLRALPASPWFLVANPTLHSTARVDIGRTSATCVMPETPFYLLRNNPSSPEIHCPCCDFRNVDAVSFAVQRRYPRDIRSVACSIPESRPAFDPEVADRHLHSRFG